MSLILHFGHFAYDLVDEDEDEDELDADEHGADASYAAEHVERLNARVPHYTAFGGQQMERLCCYFCHVNVSFHITLWVNAVVSQT